MSHYRMEFSINNHAQSFELPVLPESITIKGNGSSKTYTVAGLGEINVIKNRELRQISFNSIFPALGNRVNSSSVDPLAEPGVVRQEPGQYVQLIESWVASRRPIRFIFIGEYEINIPVSVDSFEWSEIAGSGGDLEYKIELKEYRFYAAKTLPLKKTVSGGSASKSSKATARPNERQTPKTYKIIAGDNLSKVAKKLFGNDSRWREIQKLNGITDAQLKNLKVGMVLKLPS